MKKLLLTSVAFVAFVAAPALAADMRARPVYKAPPPVAPALSWSGCYVGGHVGYAWSKWQDNVVPGATVPASGGNPVADPGDPLVFGYDGHFKTDGFAGGFQVGCDHQYGAAVFGVVIDTTWAQQDETSLPFAVVPALPPDSTDELAHVKLKYFGTARARFGWTNGPALFYVTGGLAWARAEVGYSGVVAIGGDPQPPFAFTDRAYHVGWTAGLGLDYMFAPNWTVGVEYLHLDFGDANYRFGNNFPNVTSQQALSSTNFDLRTDIVRVTLNYRFGWSGVVARY